MSKKKDVNKGFKKSLTLKKTIKDFLADEDGFVSKETILKVGLSTVAGVGLMGVMDSSAVVTHTNTWAAVTSQHLSPAIESGATPVGCYSIVETTIPDDEPDSSIPNVPPHTNHSADSY